MDETLQLVIVGLTIVVAVVVFVIGRRRRRGTECDDCDGDCPNCHK